MEKKKFLIIIVIIIAGIGLTSILKQDKSIEVDNASDSLTETQGQADVINEPPQPPQKMPRGILVERIPENGDIIFVS